MSFWIMLLIMLLAAGIGGTINYLLPANTTDNKFIKPLWHCAILGLGATLLIPIFLELAQSKLMDNIFFECKWQKPAKDTTGAKPDTVVITARYDSAGKIVKSDTVHKAAKEIKTTLQPVNDDTGKNYLLWSAYCLLAAAAGFKFIDMIISKVVVEKKLNEVENQTQKLTKAAAKRTRSDGEKQARVADQLLNKPQQDVVALTENSDKPIPVNLAPITHWDDPQKDRFGGSANRNGRVLKVEHIEEISGSNGLCNFELWVENTGTKTPFTGEVIFFLHNTFTPSVVSVAVSNNKAVLLMSEVYGAFTVGAIADNGKTLLELDLLQVNGFPQSFKDR